RAPTTPPNQPPLGGTPGVPAVRAVGQTVQYTPGGANGVSGSWTKTGSGTFTFTATNTSPAIVPGSTPAPTIPTTARHEAAPPPLPPLLPVPLLGAPPEATAAAEVPVIPEANVAVLLLTGLVALASLATWRRR